MSIDHDDVAIQLVYLVAGVETVLKNHQIVQRVKGDNEDHSIVANRGHTGMVTDLLPFAKLISGYLATSPPKEFPGVFEYEVTEELGTWVAEFYQAHDQAPTAREFSSLLDHVACQFFKRTS